MLATIDLLVLALIFAVKAVRPFEWTPLAISIAFGVLFVGRVLTGAEPKFISFKRQPTPPT